MGAASCGGKQRRPLRACSNPLPLAVCPMPVCGMVWVLGAKARAGLQGPELLVDMQEYDYSLDMWSLGSMFAGAGVGVRVWCCEGEVGEGEGVVL